MKNKISKILFAITLFITSLIGYTTVNAYNSSLIPSKSEVKPGEEFTITLNVSGLTNKLGSANYYITFNSDLFEYVSSSLKNSNLVGNTVKLAYIDANGGDSALDNGTFSKLTFKAKSSITSDATGEFQLTSKGTSDKDSDSITSTNSNTSVKVHVVSTNNYLSDLKIDGTTISGFSKDKTSYEITLDKTSVTLGATKEDSKATISGIGSKTLNYGKNTFSIVVTSEAKTTKTYTVVVNRPDNRSDDTTLKSLEISGVNFAFKNDKYDYNLTIDKEIISITALKNNSKQTISGSTGDVKLKYGTNIIKINVKSEKGTTKTYTLTITRPDSRSANNNLSSLSLSSGTINFKPSTTTYNVTVDKNTTSVTIKATLADQKSSFVAGFEPKTVNLVNGNNKVLIKVKNEKGEIKVYTLNINKDDGRDTNADLEYLKISEGTIEFNKDITNYKVTVENTVDKLTIDTKTISSKAKISITNPTLVVGENTVKILVTAENGATKEYIITVIKKEKSATLSTDNYLDAIEIDGYSLNFNKDTLRYDLKIKDEESLIIKAYASNTNSSVTISGNESLKDGSIISIKVISESGDAKVYQINIQKGEKSIPTQYLIVGILGIVLLVLIIIIVIQKKKQKDNFIIDDTVGTNGVNNVYNNQQGITQNTNTIGKTNENNITGINNSTMQNTINTPNNNINTINPVISEPVNTINNTQETISPQEPPKEIPKQQVINNPSGLTKVCSSCGRRVPYEAGTCPYCMNDF